MDHGTLSTLERFGFRPVTRILAADLDVLEHDLERSPRGESFGSVHVQTDDLPAVERTVRRFVPLLPGKSKGSVIVPPRNGWITVYDELCDREPSALPRLARELSDGLGVVVIQIGARRAPSRGTASTTAGGCSTSTSPCRSTTARCHLARSSRSRQSDARRAADRGRPAGGSRGRGAGAHARRAPAADEIIRVIADAMGIEGADHGYAQARELSSAIVIDR